MDFLDCFLLSLWGYSQLVNSNHLYTDGARYFQRKVPFLFLALKETRTTFISPISSALC